MLEPGLSHEFPFTPAGDLLTDVNGTLPAPVLSTPAVVYLMEEATLRCVAPHLDPGTLTVGFEVAIRHLARATENDACVVRAELVGVSGRKLRFNVEVRRDDVIVATGQHERRVLPR